MKRSISQDHHSFTQRKKGIKTVVSEKKSLHETGKYSMAEATENDPFRLHSKTVSSLLNSKSYQQVMGVVGESTGVCQVTSMPKPPPVKYNNDLSRKNRQLQQQLQTQKAQHQQESNELRNQIKLLTKERDDFKRRYVHQKQEAARFKQMQEATDHIRQNQ